MKTRTQRKSRPPLPQPKPLLEVERGENYCILYDRETKDYAVEVNGQPVGWRADLFNARRLVEEVLNEK